MRYGICFLGEPIYLGGANYIHKNTLNTARPYRKYAHTRSYRAEQVYFFCFQQWLDPIEPK